MRRYRFEIAGTTGGGQAYSCEGVVESLNFNEAIQEDAMRDSFQELTHGRAVFGSPGLGCRGPYKVTRFLLTEVVS